MTALALDFGAKAGKIFEGKTRRGQDGWPQTSGISSLTPIGPYLNPPSETSSACLAPVTSQFFPIDTIFFWPYTALLFLMAHIPELCECVALEGVS